MCAARTALCHRPVRETPFKWGFTGMPKMAHETVCKGYQQTTNVTVSKERIKDIYHMAHN